MRQIVIIAMLAAAPALAQDAAPVDEEAAPEEDAAAAALKATGNLHWDVVALQDRLDKLEKKMERLRARSDRKPETRVVVKREQLDLTALQIGIALTSMGAGFLVSAAFSTAGALVALAMSSDKNEFAAYPYHVTAASFAGSALLSGLLGGALVFFGRGQLDEAHNPTRATR